jgi:hypothetical protein
MDIKAVSFNVRGLSVSSAQTRLCQYLASVSFNILFMQELKLRQEDWVFFGKQIWPGVEFFVAGAEDGCMRSVTMLSLEAVVGSRLQSPTSYNSLSHLIWSHPISELFCNTWMASHLGL